MDSITTMRTPLRHIQSSMSIQPGRMQLQPTIEASCFETTQEVAELPLGSPSDEQRGVKSCGETKRSRPRLRTETDNLGLLDTSDKPDHQGLQSQAASSRVQNTPLLAVATRAHGSDPSQDNRQASIHMLSPRDQRYGSVVGIAPTQSVTPFRGLVGFTQPHFVLVTQTCVRRHLLTCRCI